MRRITRLALSAIVVTWCVVGLTGQAFCQILGTLPTSLVGLQSGFSSKIFPPVPIDGISPPYTEAARRAGIEGVVTLRFLVDETGSVKNVRVVKGLGYGLNEAAIDAVKRWRFQPAMQCYTPVGKEITWPVSFRLHDASIPEDHTWRMATLEMARSGAIETILPAHAPSYILLQAASNSCARGPNTNNVSQKNVVMCLQSFDTTRDSKFLHVESAAVYEVNNVRGDDYSVRITFKACEFGLGGSCRPVRNVEEPLTDAVRVFRENVPRSAEKYGCSVTVGAQSTNTK